MEEKMEDRFPCMNGLLMNDPHRRVRVAERRLEIMEAAVAAECSLGGVHLAHCGQEQSVAAWRTTAEVNELVVTRGVSTKDVTTLLTHSLSDQWLATVAGTKFQNFFQVLHILVGRGLRHPVAALPA
jgi:hypothetical protein